MCFKSQCLTFMQYKVLLSKIILIIIMEVKTVAKQKPLNIGNETTKKKLLVLSAVLGKSEFELLDDAITLLYEKYQAEVQKLAEKR